MVLLPVALLCLALHALNHVYKSLFAKDLKNQVVLITGGASGIGRLMALRFASKAVRAVVIWDLNKEGLRKIKEEIEALDIKCFTDIVDISSAQAVKAAATTVFAEIGKVDILINNAGIVAGKKFMEMSDEMVRKTFEVNSMSLFWTTRQFLPEMIKDQCGHIVTIASAAGLIGVRGLSAYSASKFAAVGFDEALRMELRRSCSGVKTTCVQPFFINTGMFDGVTTRFPLLLPILDQHYVANEIVRAVEMGTDVLRLPFLVKTVTLLRFLLPSGLFDFVAEILGINASMEHFVGRKKTE